MLVTTCRIGTDAAGTRRFRETADSYVLTLSWLEREKVPPTMPVVWNPELQAYVMAADPALLKRLNLALSRPLIPHPKAA